MLEHRHSTLWRCIRAVSIRNPRGTRSTGIPGCPGTSMALAIAPSTQAPDSFAGAPLFPSPKPPREYRWGVGDYVAPRWIARIDNLALFIDSCGSGPKSFFAWDCLDYMPVAALTEHGWLNPHGAPWNAPWLVRTTLSLAVVNDIYAHNCDAGEEMAYEATVNAWVALGFQELS